MIEAIEHDIQAGTLRLRVREWGSTDNPPLLLLHGLASSSHMFDLIAPELSQHWHVIAIDQRGHGQSDKPDDGYDFETLSQDIDAMLTQLALNTVPVIIGHSWGAYTALYYAATRPQKAARAVLLDGGVRPLQDRYAEWEAARIGMSPPEYHHMTEAKIHSLIRDRWLKDIFRPELEPLAWSIFDRSDPDDIHPYLSRDHHLQIAFHLWSIQPAAYFSQLRCPILMVNAVGSGQEIDPDLQRRVQEAVRLIPSGLCKTVWMQDTVHDIPWHRPTELLAVLKDFLAAPIEPD